MASMSENFKKPEIENNIEYASNLFLKALEIE